MSTQPEKKVDGLPERICTSLNKNAIAQRIREIRGTKTLSEFGKKLGVAHTTVKRYEEGMIPSPEILLAIAALAGKKMEWLLTGEERRETSPPLPPNRLSEDEYLSIPLIEGKIAAGEPIIPMEEIVEWVVLHMRPVKKAAGSKKDLVACRILGDSMYPYLASGDIVVIDRGIDKSRPQEKKIYAVWTDDGITAKMVQQEGHTMFLLPLNPAEKVRTIDLRENSSPIVGLVIGAWKDFGRL
ncbi:MAG: helix-turn-helix domain-containing protein [Nitrospinae bacterium]|nr:helix-turn-helix domain-containing protein [Nitrospinota bacterium]